MKVGEATELWWETLVQERPGLHLSMFVPMARGGIALRPNLNRWRQALRLAEERLAAAGAPHALQEDLLAPARARGRAEMALPESADGLAYFASPGFSCFVPTPFALAESAAVGAQFRLRPLLPLARAAEVSYVLAVSLNGVRLLAGSPFAVRRVELPEIATGFGAATGYTYESQRQAHSASPAALGDRGLIPHGQGGNTDERRERDLEHHFRRIWTAIAGLVPEPDAPIVLAAVEEYLPLVAAALRDPRLVDRCVAGSPDHASDEELWRRAMPIAAEWRARARARKLSAAGSGGRPALVSALSEVLPAADSGRIAHLMLGEHQERWGRYVESRGLLAERPTPHPGDEDLLERALFATLARGGEAEAVPPAELPKGAAAAAWLRF